MKNVDIRKDSIPQSVLSFKANFPFLLHRENLQQTAPN